MDLTIMVGNGDSSIKHAGKWKSSAWNLVEKCDLAIKNDDLTIKYSQLMEYEWEYSWGYFVGRVFIAYITSNPGLPKTRRKLQSPNCNVFFMDGDGLKPSWSPTHDNHQNLELEKDQTLRFTIFFTRKGRNISNQFKELYVTIIRIHQEISGWCFQPLWKIWVRQWEGIFHPIYEMEIYVFAMFQSTKQYRYV